MADEDLSGHLIRGVVRLLPELDLVRVQDIGLLSASDANILEVAADDGRTLLTHDAKTMPEQAYDRVRSGKPMPGVIVCPQNLAIGDAVYDVALLAECSEEGEWENKVVYLPI
jgi:predicted nuclease of predicted toxin-antitoxin system